MGSFSSPPAVFSRTRGAAKRWASKSSCRRGMAMFLRGRCKVQTWELGVEANKEACTLFFIFQHPGARISSGLWARGVLSRYPADLQ